MSKSKYKKYQGKKFECTGLGKCTDSNGTVRADTSTRIYESMLVSQAFMTLTPKQQILYVYCKAQYYGKTKPAADYKELGLYQENSYFYLSLKMVKAYGLYTDSTHSNFYKDMKALEEHKLIKKVCGGRYKQKSIYQYTSEWQSWGNDKK